jgi:iron complex outermembrane receptor protein
VGGVPAQPIDYSNRHFAYIPTNQISANLTVSPNVGTAGKLRFVTNLYYQSSIYFGEDYQNREQLLARLAPAAAATQPNDTIFAQSGYMLVNSRIEFNDIGGSNLSLAVWGKNLFDKRYIENVIPFTDSLGFQTGVYGAPRTYGVEVSYKF